MNDIYGRLGEILEVDRVLPGDVLCQFEYWDSLTILSIIAMLDAACGVNLTAAELRSMTNAGDLVAAVESRRSQ